MGTEQRSRPAYGLALLGTLFCAGAAAADDPAPAQTEPKLRPGQFSSTVRADKADALRKQSGSSTTITKQEIERAQPASVGELIQRVPGLQIRQEDPTGFRINIGIRGLSPTRSRLVLVEEDGVPVVVSPYGEPELYYITAVERIASLDVTKGADVLKFGPQTVGAVIQLHTFEPTEKLNGFASATFGQRGYAEQLGRMTGTFNHVGVVAQAFVKSGDGYRDMPFHQADAFVKLRVPTSASGELMVKVGADYQLANTTYTGLTQNLYAANPRADTVAPDDHFGIQRYEVALAHDQRWGARTKLHSALFFYQMDLDLRLQEFDRSLKMPLADYARVADPTGLFFRNTSALRNRIYDVAGASLELEQRFDTGPFRHRLTVGARGIFDTAHRELARGATPASTSGTALTDDRTSIFGVSGWIEDQVALTSYFLVTPAFRVEHSSSFLHSTLILNETGSPTPVDNHGSSSSTGLSPGVGVIFGTGKLNAFTSLYRGYSAPRISQAISPAGADTQLDAEYSTNWELGLRGHVNRWLRAEGDLFIINFDNELVSNNPLSGSDSEFIDGGHTQHLGAEVTIVARFGDLFRRLPIAIDLAGHYTFVRSRFVGGDFDGKTVPYSPANTTELTLDVSHRIGLSAQVAFAYVGSQYTDEQNTVAGGPTGLDGRIDGYTNLDLAARYTNARTGLGIGLAVKNVLDRVYISDRLPNGIFTSGFRQIYGTVSWSSRN